MLKKTSKDGMVLQYSEKPAGAFLADFDIDGASLKPDHYAWLDRYILEPVKAKPTNSGQWKIRLLARASQSGSDEYNSLLSGLRAGNVASYLSRQLIGVPFFFSITKLGESSPFDTKKFENELDRSVEVFAKFLSRKSSKPFIHVPKKIVHWKPLPSRKVSNFTLQVLKAKITINTLDMKFGPGSVGLGIAHVKMFIVIRESGSVGHALYKFEGAGRGSIVGVSPSYKKLIPGPGISSFSESFENGAIHSFVTEIKLDAYDFEGDALFIKTIPRARLIFGPKPRGFFSPNSCINGLSLGLPRTVSFLKIGECDVMSELCVVRTVPPWEDY